MGFYTAVEISASGLSAERLAMDVIANNIANANTTRTPQGGAFKRQLIVFAQKGAGPGETDGTTPPSDDTFGGNFDKPPTQALDGVQAVGIVDDPSPDRMVFDPGNPDADARGYVHYPNVQVVNEMVDMMAASRAYEANVAVIQETKSMNSASMGLLTS
ncbi:MAG: flagellar basal body rod protein FlgC [Candidatus Eremiobacteraeota bacterium]|nr:flagellar basal body rod protein FlgC [Candidatus Eremiobacteraeota bacterium]